MDVQLTELEGVLVFRPTPHRDERGFFSRTFDAAAARAHGIRPEALVQDSQSRTRRGVVRGLHGRLGQGEAKLMRCARGAAHLVVVDARLGSATLGRHVAMPLDDEALASVWVPRGMLVGFQALSEEVDLCYRIDREHDEREGVAVRHDDPDLAIRWPRPVEGLSRRDREAGSWADLLRRAGADG
jgi:dTDP-4-dehydrorhamnose 3,5-epimerase